MAKLVGRFVKAISNPVMIFAYNVFSFVLTFTSEVYVGFFFKQVIGWFSLVGIESRSSPDFVNVKLFDLMTVIASSIRLIFISWHVYLMFLKLI